MSRIQDIFEEHLKCIQAVQTDSTTIMSIEKIIHVLVNAFKEGRKVLFCGNGGSAADAAHLAAELSGKFNFDRAPLDAGIIHDNVAALTAVSNDFGYAHSFARLLEARAKEGDILIALSTSGKSENVINAVVKANEMKLTTISITGNNQNLLMDLSDIYISIASGDTARIQEATMLIGHIICEEVESNLFTS